MSGTLGRFARDTGLREAHRANLRRALAEGLRQADRGELLDGFQVVAELRESIQRREMVAARKS